MVRLYRTFSNYIFTGETRCAGCLCTSSVWLKRIKPPRTFSNHIITEIARCVEFFHMSSGWFDCTEPSRPTSSQRSLQGKQGGVQGAYALVRGGSCASNLLTTGETRWCAGCLCTSSGWFKRIEPSQTFSNHIIAEITRCVEFNHMSSGWFDCTELL